MSGQRSYGMDNPYYEWSPLPMRPVLRWPNEARIALCVVVQLDHLEWNPPKDAHQYATIAGGRVGLPFPDFVRYTHREYGHRVGIFRVMEILKEFGVRPSVAMDAMTAENYPYLVRYCSSQSCEIIGHGISASRMITGLFDEEKERDYIRTSLDALRNATGSKPQAWMGIESGESARSPRLLAEQGIRYLCDWANDDQPYMMKTPAGDLVHVSALLDYDDAYALWTRRMPPEDYASMLKKAFDVLWEEGEHSSRMMVLNLHPFLIGQPFRIGYLHDILEHMTGYKRVWTATVSEIAEHYRRQTGLPDLSSHP